VDGPVGRRRRRRRRCGGVYFHGNKFRETRGNDSTTRVFIKKRYAHACVHARVRVNTMTPARGRARVKRRRAISTILFACRLLITFARRTRIYARLAATRLTLASFFHAPRFFVRNRRDVRRGRQAFRNVSTLPAIPI